MRTIAITVDDETLALIDELYERTNTFSSRSALVRAAIREYARLTRKRAEEERERAILHANKDRLDKELAALILEQAKS